MGYQLCDMDASVEILYEKIALFGYPGQDDGFSHVAYQLYFGWTSKLGGLHDIIHKTLTGLECDNYGVVKAIMKRRSSLRGFIARAFFNQTARLWPVDWKPRIEHRF